jgi:hypothetical protein
MRLKALAEPPIRSRSRKNLPGEHGAHSAMKSVTTRRVVLDVNQVIGMAAVTSRR